jgi:2-oxoglutarate dehydrogenase complex dehydrogenase (E1) component-like enzyme
MKVVHPSTAANYFHLLRTHMRMPFRKPMVVVAPKKLLRFKGATSSLDDFGEGTTFMPIIKDQNKSLVANNQVRKIILCSGQVYFDLEQERANKGNNDVAIVRVESLCPFPFHHITDEFKQYPNASVTWAQEEPKNGGAWSYVQPRLRNIQKHIGRKCNITYAGRPIMSATAVGFTKTHNEQLVSLISEAFE